MLCYIRRGEVQERLKELVETSPNTPASAISMVRMLIDALNSVTEYERMTEYVNNTLTGLHAIERTCGSEHNGVRDLMVAIEKSYKRWP